MGFLRCLHGALWIEEQELQAGDPTIGALFGASLALEGDRAIISAPGHNLQSIAGGLVYYFRWNGTGWIEEAQIRSVAPQLNARFGSATALWGSRALVGAPRLANPSSQQGTLFEYELEPAQDCNGNGVVDLCDVITNFSLDINGDQLPDECGPDSFERGDCEASGTITISDAIFLLDYPFGTGQTPSCNDACDINDDGLLDLSDAIGFLSYLFELGMPPPAPLGQCGFELTPLDGLTCDSFAACP